MAQMNFQNKMTEALASMLILLIVTQVVVGLSPYYFDGYSSQG